jgi:hypothetical protein
VLFGVCGLPRAGHDGLVHLDQSVARVGCEHLSSFSRQGLEAITHLGEPTSVVVMAVALAAVETVRTRSRWVVPFVAVVVAGNGIITTTVKHLADRVRPELNPIAETLGPSFPSGHSSWSAAVLRGRGAAAQPRAQSRSPSRAGRRRGGHHDRDRRQPRPAERALAERRDRRPRGRLRLVRRLRHRLRRAAPDVRRARGGGRPRGAGHGHRALSRAPG